MAVDAAPKRFAEYGRYRTFRRSLHAELVAEFDAARGSCSRRTALLPAAMVTTVRAFRDDDAAATARIYFDAVRIGARTHYGDAQRRAWAPRVPETAAWLDRLRPQTVLVAERDGQVIGFMTLTAEGCIDLAFVTPDHIGRGVAKQLYDAILAEAEGRGLASLHTEASHLARAFFERQGWSVVRPQTVSRDGVEIANFVMRKDLT